MNRVQSYYLYLAAIMFFVMAAFNLLAASTQVKVLVAPDSLLPLSNRWVLLLSAGLELITSAYLLAGKKNWAKLCWAAWLGTNLAVYRFGLWHTGAASCGDYLGNYLDWFLIRPRTMAFGADFGIGFILAGSYGLMMIGWVQSRKPSKIEAPSAVPQPYP